MDKCLKYKVILKGAAGSLNFSSQNLLDTVEVLTGSKVYALLNQENFLAEWDSLYEECPWGTVYQSSTFVKTWYENYGSQHNPVLAISRLEDRLIGLLPLAEGIKGLGIAGAGGWDSYYHTWLASAGYGEAFITAALQAICSHFPNKDIFLKYIPPQAPKFWLKRDQKWNERCVARTFNRPLLNLRASDVDKLLQTKMLRKKSNRLKRIGSLRMETIESLDSFKAVLVVLTEQLDFRKAATHNLMPFKVDQQKKELLIDLFKKNLLITTVLKVDEEIIAGYIATIGKHGWVHGTIITHAPAFSHHSPGYMIMKLLAVKLKQQEYSFFDFTPGSNGYKELHANNNDEVYELLVTSRAKASFMKLFFEFKELVKTNLDARGINPRSLSQSFLMKLKMAKEHFNISWAHFQLQRLACNPLSQSKVKILRLSIPEKLPAVSIIISKNCLNDLLSYSSQGTGVPSWRFMKDAMKFYEEGLMAYTYCEDNKLLCLVWHNPIPVKLSETMKDILSPDGATTLRNFYWHHNAANQVGAFLRAVAVEIKKEQDTTELYLLDSVLPINFRDEGLLSEVR